MHVRLMFERGTAEEGQLFKTIGLDLEGLAKPKSKDDLNASAHVEHSESAKLAVRVTVGQENQYFGLLNDLDTLSPLGGERRLVRWQATTANGWSCPQEIYDALCDAQRLRMTLATPAVFEKTGNGSGGWLPDWLEFVNGAWRGELPGFAIKLRLVGVSNGRWAPISGWSLERGREGPKPTRRLVPAGSTYFFEREGGEPSSCLGDAWLESVCGDVVNRRDGFGLALWGIWDEFK